VIAHRVLVLAVAGLALITSAGRAAADEKTKTPDLSELKYAVTMADKRGENVGAIREALTAFEKALAKSTIKAGEAPPELTALREAVELASKKGENVEAIAKELGLIEKAVTGSEYVRPKPPEPPKAEPEPPFRQPFPPRRGGIGVGGNGGNPWGRGGANFNSTSITITNGNFTVRAKQGAVSYLVVGSLNGNEAPKITIQDGEKKIETDELKKVPEEYRPAAERLLMMVTRQ